MAERHLKDLERAKELFYSWKLHDAYLLLRRFFDRLPFNPQKEHALYLSYFIRCLLELGKDRELGFYKNQVEVLAQKWKTPDLFYQLAEIYCLGPQKNTTAAKKLLQTVIADPSAKVLHTKAKIFLAYCLDVESGYTAACKEIIRGIEEPDERSLKLSLDIWKVKILRDEGKWEEAQKKIESLIQELDPQKDWYAYFSAQIILSGIFLRQSKREEALTLLVKTRKTVEESPFRTVKNQLIALEEDFKEKPMLPEIVCEQGIHAWRLTWGGNRVEIKHQTGPAKIFELLAKKDWVDKEQLAKKILKKGYVPELDDQKIHFQIHSLRKTLMELKFDFDPICFEDGGYRMLPKLIIHEGEI